MNALSISQIKKLGKSIRKLKRAQEDIPEESLAKLQDYRVHHQPVLRTVFDFLVNTTKKQNKGNLVVYRLKRIDTIIRKIERYPTMDLSNMQDIAGCRAIVYNETQIRNIVRDFKSNENFRLVEYDYLNEPRDSGYKSYHLVVTPIDSDCSVEIQLRTRTQHYWATLVEITDLIYQIKLKEGEENPELFRFHKHLSNSPEQLSLNDREDLIQIERKHGLITKLIKLFKSNYYTSLQNWNNAERSSNDEYLLVQLDDKLTPQFTFFQNFETAERVYFEKFNSIEPEMVLIHIVEPDLEKLELCYSNYVLTSHPSIRIYLSIVVESALDYKKRKSFKKAEELKSYIDNLMITITSSIEEESFSINNRQNKNGDGSDSRTLDWKMNLLERLDYVKNMYDDFKSAYYALPNKNLSDIVRNIFR